MTAGQSFAERFHAGETGAIEAMTDALGPAAFAVADAVLDDPEAAERVVASTIALMLEHTRETPVDASQEAALLVRLARLRALGIRREQEGGRRRRRQESRQADEAFSRRGALPPLPASAEARAALESLRPPVREAVSLAYFEGLRLPEVASRAGTTVETARQRLRAGLAELQETPAGALEVDA